MCLLLRSGFRLATLPYRPDWKIAAEMVVLLEGSPLSTEERWSSDRVTRVLGHLPSPPIAQFRQPASPDGSELLPFTDDGGHCAHWDHQSSRIFSVPFPIFVPQDNSVLEVYRQFFEFMLGLCSDMHRQLWDWCVPFQIMSNQLNLPQVDSN